uniref:Putative secreted protein n=1 Tax=Anopheles darlingi TaxID=43151 RepID=A0A2M4D6S5_ANODA
MVCVCVCVCIDCTMASRSCNAGIRNPDQIWGGKTVFEGKNACASVTKLTLRILAHNGGRHHTCDLIFSFILCSSFFDSVSPSLYDRNY